MGLIGEGGIAEAVNQSRKQAPDRRRQFNPSLKAIAS
jgi:hypothetical protein